MILLDTNVISELMRAEPAQIVLDWFGDHDAGDLFISAVTEAELRTGVAILPDGQRRDRLQLAIHARFAAVGSVDLPPTKRGAMRPTPDFE